MVMLSDFIDQLVKNRDLHGDIPVFIECEEYERNPKVETAEKRFSSGFQNGMLVTVDEPSMLRVLIVDDGED